MNKTSSVECLDLKFSTLTKYHSYTYRWSNTDTLFHRHVDFYEIILITKGSFFHYYGNSVERLEQGTLIIFDNNQIHKLTPKPAGSIHFTICLTKPYFHLLMQLFSFNQNLFENTPYISRQLNETTFQYLLMLANALTSGQQESNNIKLFFHNALSMLLSNTTNSSLDSNDMVDDILEKLRNYSYLTIPVQKIYEQYPCCTSTIIKKFKQRTGMTIVRFQTNLRLDFAARLMRETNNSIEQIANDLGFLSTSHFFEIFKERYGQTPNAYRKIAKAHPEDYEFLQLDNE